MRNFLLFTSLAILSLSASAQVQNTPARMQPRNGAAMLDKATAVPQSMPTTNKPQSQTRDQLICWAEMGSSTNAFSTLRATSHCLAVNNDLNTVVFIYRNDENHFSDWTSSQYRYAVSYNRGNNFDAAFGPLNPSANNNVGGINARYPQAAIYNPAGNTDPENAWLAYIGAWHNGATGNETWEGLGYGAVRLDNDLTTATEHFDLTNDGNVLIPNSLVEGQPGEYWAIDEEYTGDVNDSMLILYKGTWTGTDVAWTVDRKLNPGWVSINDTIFSYGANIAFDGTGMNGWIGGIAHIDENQNLSPYFYRTTDGGDNWEGPFVVNLGDMPNLMTELESPAGATYIPTAIDQDLVVDHNGHPHMSALLSPGGTTPTTYYPGLMNVYDLTFDGTTWSNTLVSLINFYEGAIGTSQGSAYNQYTRLQSSITPDGKWVSMIWADSDPASNSDNSLPNLIGAALNVDMDTMTAVKNFTMDDDFFSGYATQHLISHVSFYNNATGAINVPTVVTQLNTSPESADGSPTYYYLRNINFNDNSTDCNINVSVTPLSQKAPVFALSPNPATNEIVVSGEQLEGCGVRVVNVLGQTVKTFDNVKGQTLRIETNELSNGVYTATIVRDNSSNAMKFIVQR